MLHSKTFRTRSIGWALFGVNFRPLQEIEAIMGGGRIFDSYWALFRETMVCITQEFNNLRYSLHLPSTWFRMVFSDFCEYIRMFTRKFVVKLRAERFLSRANRLCSYRPRSVANLKKDLHTTSFSQSLASHVSTYRLSHCKAPGQLERMWWIVGWQRGDSWNPLSITITSGWVM